MREVKSFIDLMKSFYDEKSCREFLEDIKWRGEPICSHCNCQTKEHYKLKSNGEFKGLYKCKRCKKRFTVTIGTMFEGSHVSLKKWFYALYIFLAHKKGIGSIQLSKDIDVTQKTAWFMLERIRHNLKDKLVVQFNDMTQVDETYVGGKNKGRVKNAQGRSLKVKTPVVGLLYSRCSKYWWKGLENDNQYFSQGRFYSYNRWVERLCWNIEKLCS